MKTRKQYMAGNVTHRNYYGQFVNGSIKSRVLAAFTTAELLASKDEHLNDLALERWDRCAGGMATELCANSLRQAGDGPSLSSAVCILKEAARQIIEAERGQGYQPKTGAPCSCRPGIQRDNCPQCEGTGQRIDFRAIHERGTR